MPDDQPGDNITSQPAQNIPKPQPINPPSSPDNPSTNNAQAVTQKTVETEIHGLEDRVRGAEKWMIWLTGGIVFLTAGIVIVGIFQWRAMVGDPKVTLLPHQPSDIRIKFVNTGKTPALNVHSVIEMKRIEEKGISCYEVLSPSTPDTRVSKCIQVAPVDIVATPTFDYTETQAQGRSVLMPGQLSGEIGQRKVTLTDVQYGQIVVGRFRFYIGGTVWYDDIFGRHQTTEFCMVYVPTEFSMAGCTFHNKAN